MFFIYRMGGGGAARTMLNIVNYIDREKFEPILVTLDFIYDYEQYVKDDVTFIKLNTKRLRASILPLAKLIRKERPHILFSTIPTYNTVATLAKLLSCTRTKLIVREAAFLGGDAKIDRKLKLFGFVYRFAHQVISLSEGVKQNLIERYKVKPEKIKVIYNPVDISHIQQQMVQENSTIDPTVFTEDKKVIVTAGRLVKEKDQLTLIRAFANVQKQMPCTLLILGEGELEATLKREAKKLGVSESVHVIGFRKNPYPYFHQADVFALTSLTEGFGHVLVEAMVTGTPVVSTRSKPGAEEVLLGGEYGLLCEVGDVTGLTNVLVEALSWEEDKRKVVIEKGWKRANQFDATTIVTQYEATFLEVLKKQE